MAQDHALHAEMAEEGNTVVIRMKGAVNASFSFVSVLQEKGVDAFADRFVFFADVGLRHRFRIHPGLFTEEGVHAVQILGQPVPGDHGSLLVGTVDLRVEFPEPGQGLRGHAEGVQGIGRGHLRPSQGGLIGGVDPEPLLPGLF